MKITIPDGPKTRHDQACELRSKMSVSVFGNLDWTFAACQFRGRFLDQRLQLVGAKTRRLRDGRMMSRSDLLFCLSNRRISHSSAHSGILAPTDCVRLAKCVSAMEEKKDLLKVASAFVAENALPLTSLHVKNFTRPLKRMHPAVGKAVCVMCQCLNNQIELDQFAESGGMPVFHNIEARWRWNRISLAAGCDETRRAHLQPAA